MKKTFYLLFLLIGVVAFGQNKTFSSRFLHGLSLISLKPTTFQINLNTNNSFSNSNYLALYNPMTNLNDNYYILGKSYRMSNTKSFPMYGFEGQRIDSFNPSGTKDLGSAFIFGAINTILDKL